MCAKRPYIPLLVFVVGNHRANSNTCENNIGYVETPERSVPNSHNSAPNNFWGSSNVDSYKNVKGTLFVISVKTITTRSPRTTSVCFLCSNR